MKSEVVLRAMIKSLDGWRYANKIPSVSLQRWFRYQRQSNKFYAWLLAHEQEQREEIARLNRQLEMAQYEIDHYEER